MLCQSLRFQPRESLGLSLKVEVLNQRDQAACFSKFASTILQSRLAQIWCQMRLVTDQSGCVYSSQEADPNRWQLLLGTVYLARSKGCDVGHAKRWFANIFVYKQSCSGYKHCHYVLSLCVVESIGIRTSTSHILVCDDQTANYEIIGFHF